MTFQIKHDRKNSFGGNFLKIGLALLLIAAAVLVFAVSDWGRSWSADFLSIFLKSGDNIYGNTGQIAKSLSGKDELLAENQKLAREIEKYRLDLLDYELVKYENKNLRETLEFKPAGNFAVSNIIAKSPQIPLDSLFLDKGLDDGLSGGDAVLASGRVLIGKIVKTSKNKSTVALNSFVGTVSYGFVGRTKEPLQIEGAGGGRMEVKAPIDFDIVVGDEIMVGGSDIYLIAIVGAVAEDRSSGFKDVIMSLPVDVSKINTVFVEQRDND